MMKGFRCVVLVLLLFTSKFLYAGDLFEVLEWQKSQSYQGKDLAVFQQNLYVAKYWTQGDQPDESTHVWSHINIDSLPHNWSDEAIYMHGDAVVFNEDIYIAAWWNQGEAPELTNDWGAWVYLGKADQVGPTLTLTSPLQGESLTSELQPVIIEVVDEHLSNRIEDYSIESSAGQALSLSWQGDDLIVTPDSDWTEGEFTLTVNAKDLWGNSSNTQFTLIAELVVPIKSQILAVPSRGTAPLQVLLSPDVITNKAINLYRWDLDGNGTFERQDTVGRSQSYTYTSPGTYKAALEITDSLGRKDTGYIDIVVENGPPVVSAAADKTNGHVPLTVQFSAQVTDNEGISSFAWDFDGDGVIDITSSSAVNVSHTYEQIGTFQASVIVTDSLGKTTTAAVPNIEIRAVDPSAPTVTLSLSASSGKAPLDITMSPTVAHSETNNIKELLWDFDGDGLTDKVTSSTESVQWTYRKAGTFYPSLTVTFVDETIAKDVRSVTVQESLGLSIVNNNIDPSLNQTAIVKTTLSADLLVSVQIENRSGQVIRTLIPWGEREAGTYEDEWDGLDDQGIPLAQGDYYAILNYQKDGESIRYDLRPSTSGSAYNPSRSRIPSNFEPYNGKPLTIDFTLNKPSEVTAFMGLFYTNTRLVTFKNREALGTGKHTIVWDGLGDDGKPVITNTSNPFLFGIWGYTLGDNAIFLSSGPKLSGFKASPSIVVANTHTESSDGMSHLHFQLSKSANIELKVSDVETGSIIRREIYPNVASGTQELLWDLTSDEGHGVASGRYRIGIRAIDQQGYTSPYVYTLQRVYY